MTAGRRMLGRSCLRVARVSSRGYSKIASLLEAGAFDEFGSGSVLQRPLRLSGEHRIRVGRDVFVGGGSWLQVLDEDSDGVAITIGDGSSFSGGCVVSAASSITIGRRVLFARNVYVADHQHAFSDTSRAVLDQGVERIRPVEIGDGAWLGENVVVGPGVRIGAGAVIGANAVVLSDVPDHCVAVGAPARVTRRFGVQAPLEVVRP